MSEKIYWLEVLISLRRIIHATDLQSKQVVKACGLTIPQIMVLGAIDRLGDVTIKRISDDVSLSQATVTTILNRLEQRELVERVRNADDKRIVNARLTAAGSGALSAAPPLLHESFIQRFESLGKREKAKILSSLRQIAKMMDADDIEAVPLHDIAPLAGLQAGVADPS
jgi:DNA-binding MarR family transcriptional regulator